MSRTRPTPRRRPLETGIVRRGLRVLFAGIGEEPRVFGVAVAGSALFAVMTVASALVLGQVTDRVLLPAFEAGAVDRGLLAGACAVIVAVGLAKALGVFVRRAAATWVQYRLEGTFRERITRRYQRLPLSWHRRHSAGELMSVANSDVETTWQAMAPLPFALGVVLMLVLSGAALLVVDPWLALVGALVAPAMAWVNLRYNARAAGPAMGAQELRAEVSSHAHASFDAALPIKTLGIADHETVAFADRSERLRDELFHLGRVRALYDPLLEALPNLGVLAILLVGGLRVASGAVSPGDVVFLGYLFTLVAFPVRLIGMVLNELPRTVVGWSRLRGVLDANDAVDEGPGDDTPEGPAALDLVQVTFRYPDADPRDPEPVADVTFAAPAGRTIALVGPTGAGKSTIASLLVRLTDPEEGTVQLDGRDLRSLRKRAVSSQAAIVFQRSFLFDDTVRESVNLGRDYDDAAVEAALRLAQAWDFVRALPEGLDTVLGERGTSLSGGQQQRLALARALVRQPRLLILDDATSSLDARVETRILHGLQEAALPSTLIVVASRRSTIALADEVVYVERGRVAARGSHEALLASTPGYAGLMGAYGPNADPDAPGQEGPGQAGPGPGGRA